MPTMMWQIYDLYLELNKDKITVEDAMLIYYFLEQVERSGYESTRIRSMLDCYLHFNRSAWVHIQYLTSKGAFYGR